MKIRNKKKNKILKFFSVVSEDCQAFGVLVNKAQKLTKAFKYHIISVPLAVATPEYSPQSDEARLKNDVINLSKSSRDKCQEISTGW